MLEQFKTSKPVVAMVHLPATPGTPRHISGVGFEQVLDGVQRDIDHLVDGGVDGLMFCNEDDRPYTFEAGPATVAFMARVIEASDTRGLPFGVDVLWDPIAAIAIASVTGAGWVREVVSGTYESDMGVWALDPERIWSYRKSLDAQGVEIWANIQPEFASPLGSRDIAQRASSTLASCIPDALLISGPMAGQAPDRRLLEETRAAIPDDTPLITNTGAKPETVADFLAVADGVIVGSSLKVGGDTWAAVAPERVQRFMSAVETVR